MATDIYGMLNAGSNPYADQVNKQQQLFQQQLSQATDPRAFIAAVGGNMGAQLGMAVPRLFGAKSEEEKKAEAIKQVMTETKGETDPIKRLRSVAERLRNLGMEGAAMQVEDQANKYEDRALSAEDRKASILERDQRIAASKAEQARKDAIEAGKPKVIADRVATLTQRYPEMSDADKQAIAEDDVSYRSYIKKPEDLKPSEYGKSLIEAGYDPQSQEYKDKMRQWTDAKLSAERDKNTAAISQVKLLQAQADLEAKRFKIDQDEKKQAKALQKARLTQMMGESHNKMITSRIDSAIGLISKDTVGWKALLLKELPETKARALAKKLDVIKANIGFDRLQQMRESSPTGGALGQVAVQELYSLQNSIDALDQLQTGAELEEALNNIKRHYANFLRNQKASMDANEPLMGSPEAEATSPSAGGGSPKPTKRWNPATGKLEDV